MKTKVDALKEYYIAKSGDLEDIIEITTVTDMIEAITALPGGGGDIDLSGYVKKKELEGYAKAEELPDMSILNAISVTGGTENFIIPNECKTNWKPTFTQGTAYADGAVTSGYSTSNLISGMPAGTKLKLSLREIPSYFRVIQYRNGMYAAGDGGSIKLDEDGYAIITLANANDFCLVFNKIVDWTKFMVASVENFGEKRVSIDDLVLSEETKKGIDTTPNVLKGKKWAVCGDSFSIGASSEIIENGKYAGQKVSYPYLIAGRNDMSLQMLAKGGKTLADPEESSFTNTFSKEYKTIDSDVDYITLYLGINDSHHRPDSTGSDGEDTTGKIPLGAISDTTVYSFYGAWNVILAYLIKNYPNAKIGILVSNGCETDDYRIATISCAKKWGIPYIDLNGDERTPAMIRSTNPDISSEVKNARLIAWRVSADNAHPNADAHRYESTYIENFLRSL
ncbi:SGNH/GDSL hydrolase family protein [Butyrivibrio sp. MB2005]|uniref:SGNH/GDSL hydrolase family protein n=1 Tax=Butyrivibrio sp. MB2005 TaxID=1280678 RepID=UPI0004046CDC|nr:SGNH/GDSL hydrolase family protein [Butyrivibrio sp. MB2005]